MDSPPTAPVRTWLVAGVLTAAVILGAWFVAIEVGPPPQSAYVEFNRARIDRLAGEHLPAGTRTVLMVGSSVLKYATRQEAEFGAAIEKVAGQPIRVLRLVSNGGSFSNMVPLLDDLKAMHIDLLVMQRDQLVADRPHRAAFGVMVDRMRLRIRPNPTTATESRADENDVQFSYPCWKREHSRNLEEHLEHRDNWVMFRPGGPSATAARNLVESALARGAVVALVDLPRRPDYDADARLQRDAAMREPALSDLNERVEYWDHGPLAASFYCDVSHVTPAGQGVFSTWLESKIAWALARGPK